MNCVMLGNCPTVMSISPPRTCSSRHNHLTPREFTRRWGLDARKGGGAHMWQEIWNEDVSIIYKDILRESRRVYLCLTPVIGLILSGNVS